MKIDQGWFNDTFERVVNVDQIINKNEPSLVLVIGDLSATENPIWFSSLRSTYPNSAIISCSSSEVILGSSIHENILGFTAIQFEKTPFLVNQGKVDDSSSIFEAGQKLVQPMIQPDLKAIFLFSDGQGINGSELISGVNSVLNESVIVTGGMASDGAQFVSTAVGYNEMPSDKQFVAVGLYGDSISVGYGSKGGWEAFGPKRLVTKSSGNILYELDDKNALELYKKYLGEMASRLPGSAFLFPLALYKENISDYLVRTVLDVNEADSSMVFAGDIPEGSLVQLMKANFDRLIDGAAAAAEHGMSSLKSESAEFALLISCIGRKLVLGQRVEEEIELCSSIFGENTIVTGFYSHGEFSPLNYELECQLHNQSMTVTTLSEN